MSSADPPGEDAAAPFVPRLIAEWLRDEPERRWRSVDGALVFVDISGFTAMSERLSVLGREGAERVTEIIDGAFSQLLREAYQLDGSLLKFGGDALLLLFDGDDAALRAAAAAHDMRDALYRLGSVATPAGAVDLDMSVGVHAGQIDLFLVGRSHRELIVTGPGATAVVRAEGEAGTGRILLSSGAVAALPDSVVGEAIGSGRLLEARPRVDRRPSSPVEPSPSTWRGVSSALRRHLIDGGRERSEHRRAVVGFVHFEGTDEVLAEGGHEALASALDELVVDVQSAVDRRRLCLLASDVDEDGGKLIVTAGVPAAHEDDVDRLLLTMLEIVDRDRSIPVRIGVQGGALFAGEVGPHFRRTYTVMGDVVNTAARVMSRAGQNQVLATDELLATATVPYEVVSVAPFAVKGKAEPLIASQVISARDADPGLTGGAASASFVGRAVEVAELVRAFDRACDGRGSAVELLGPAGVGKTEILRSVHDIRPDASLVVLRCLESTSDIAYRPVRAAMLGAFDIPVNEAPESARTRLRAAVGDALGPDLAPIEVALGLRSPDGDLDAKSFRIDLAAAVDRLLRTFFTDGVLLVIENAQWADDGTAELVRALAARSADRPYLIAVTARTERPTMGGRAVVVSPLGDFEAEELARLESGDKLLPAEASELARRAGGNPLFIVELVRAASARRVADDDADLPETLEGLLAERIDRTAPADRALLRQLAVLGDDVDVDELVAFIGSDGAGFEETLQRLGDLLALDSERRSVRFRQTLLHAAAYQGLPFRRRRLLHRLAADLLEERLYDPAVRAEDLSRHCTIAQDRPRAWRYSLLAAERAMDRAGFSAAADFYGQAIDSARGLRIDSASRAEAYRLWGHSSMLVGRYSDAGRALQRAGRLEGGPAHAARVALNKGQLAREQGNLAVAIRHFRRGRRLVIEAADMAPDAEQMLARSYLGEAAVRLTQGRPDDAEAAALEGLRRAEAADDELAVANACTWLIQTSLAADEERALALGRRATEIFEKRGRRRHLAHVQSALSGLLFDQGRWREAFSYGDEAIATLDDLGLPVESAIARMNLGFCAERQRWNERAVALFGEAHRVLDILEHPWAAYALGMRVAASVAPTTELDELFDQYREATRRLVAEGNAAMADDVHLAWADAMVDRGEVDLAVRALETIGDRQTPEVRLRLPRLEGRLALLNGDLDRAWLLADEAVEVASTAGDEYAIARALDLRADLTESTTGSDADAALASGHGRRRAPVRPRRPGR